MQRRILRQLVAMSIALTGLTGTAHAQYDATYDYTNEANKTAHELSAFRWKKVSLNHEELVEPLEIESPLELLQELLSEEAFAQLQATAISLLGSLEQNPSPVTNEPQPYKRLLHFGTWVELDPMNCRNVRAEVLIRDSQTDVTFKDGNECSVMKGHWHDPYTNRALKSATHVQIDHFVPLKHAYLSGAYRWSRARRCHYSNYMGNNYHLLSVDGDANQQKSDSSPDDWMPSNKAYACEYMKNWLKIKMIWNLSVSQSEISAIRSQMKTHKCETADMKITVKELSKQRDLSERVIDVCR